MKKFLKKLARIFGNSALILVMVAGIFAVIPPNRAQAAVSFVGSSNIIGTNGTAPGAITPHASTAVGDLLIFYHFSRSPGNNETVTLPVGFTSVFNAVTTSGLVAVGWRIRQSGDTTYTAQGVTNHATGTSGDAIVEFIETYRGTHTTSPIVNFTASNSTWASATNIGPIAAAATATVDDGDALVVFGGRFENITAQTTLTGHSLTWAQGTRADTTQGADAGAVTQHGINASGSTQTVTAKTITTTGTAQIGSGRMFTIEKEVLAAPTVTTQAASSVGQNSATANGNITATGGSSATVRGFAWGTNSALSGGDTATTTENGTFSTGAFTGALSSLTCNTTYYYRPYATNPTGTGLGTIVNFTTSACTIPTVTTQAESNVTINSATANGNITSLGGAANVTVRGFAYGTVANLSTVVATTTENGTFSTGAFTGALSSLTCNTTYYSRPYATNSIGTGFGTIDSFTTSACPTTTIDDADGSSATTIAPGDSPFLSGIFLFNTSAGTDTITSLTLTLGDAGVHNGIAKVEVKDNTGTVDVCTDADNPSSITPTLTCSITVTTEQVDYGIYITPKAHADMPVPPGNDYNLDTRVTNWTGTNPHAGNDLSSAGGTIDNSSPSDVASATASGTTNEAQHTLGWSNPVEAGYEETIVLRRSGSAVADTPVEGTDYSVGNTIGSSMVACVEVDGTCSDAGLTPGTAYHYKAFTKDSSGNYAASGVTPTGSPVTSSATFTQQAYRFFASSAGVTPGAALADQDTPATLTSAGETFRMRALIRVDTKDVSANGRSFKVQYAAKSGTCDASFTGETYADITTATPIAYLDLPSPADNTALGAQADMTDGARTIVNQTYEELNNFTNSQGSIASGQDGKWDFSFVDNTGQSNTSYCIRIVKSDGGTLDTYTSIAEVVTAAAGAPDIQIYSSRWINDNGDELNATFDNDGNVYKGDRTRLRFSIENAGTASADSYAYKLEHASSSCDVWLPVPSITSLGNEHWVMDTSVHVADGTATTDMGAVDSPAGKDFVAGFFKTQSNQTSPLTLATTEFTEIEYVIRSTTNSTVDTLYCFRVTNAGSVTNFTYTNPPSVTVLSVASRPGGSSGGGGTTGAGGESQGGGAQQTGGTGGGTGGAGAGGAGGEGQTGGGAQQGGGTPSGGGGDSGYIDYRKAFASAVLWIIR
jgi:hypothetical protein